MPTDDRPTQKQQCYLRSLAQRTGTSFTPPSTKVEASREIKRLKQQLDCQQVGATPSPWHPGLPHSGREKGG